MTPQTRQKTRQTILGRAAELFRRAGYEAATTRDIAAAAGIAAGTLFNYFPTKEALGLALAAEAIGRAEEELEATRRPGETLEERLFAHVAIQLRHLEPLRPWLADVLLPALSPLRAPAPEGTADELRRVHLERVADWIGAEGGLDGRDLDGDLHLYWSLYLGVVGYWARDDSERQAATLALLDRSVGMFCRALRGQ